MEDKEQQTVKDRLEFRHTHTHTHDAHLLHQNICKKHMIFILWWRQKDHFEEPNSNSLEVELMNQSSFISFYFSVVMGYKKYTRPVRHEYSLTIAYSTVKDPRCKF